MNLDRFDDGRQLLKKYLDFRKLKFVGKTLFRAAKNLFILQE